MPFILKDEQIFVRIEFVDITIKMASEEIARKKSLTWDEENLDYNEENKTPKMKIDEPPTPFNFDYCDDELVEGADGDLPPIAKCNAICVSVAARAARPAARLSR